MLFFERLPLFLCCLNYFTSELFAHMYLKGTIMICVKLI